MKEKNGGRKKINENTMNDVEVSSSRLKTLNQASREV